MALEHLEAQLTRLRREALAEWTVVMWVLRACPLDMHRYLKCNWELEQPRVIENWLVSGEEKQGGRGGGGGPGGGASVQGLLAQGPARKAVPAGHVAHISSRRRVATQRERAS